MIGQCEWNFHKRTSLISLFSLFTFFPFWWSRGIFSWSSLKEEYSKIFVKIDTLQSYLASKGTVSISDLMMEGGVEPRVMGCLCIFLGLQVFRDAESENGWIFWIVHPLGPTHKLTFHYLIQGLTPCLWINLQKKSIFYLCHLCDANLSLLLQLHIFN